MRNGFSHDMADLLVDDLQRALSRLRQQDKPQRGREWAAFSHGADTSSTHKHPARKRTRA